MHDFLKVHFPNSRSVVLTRFALDTKVSNLLRSWYTALVIMEMIWMHLCSFICFFSVNHTLNFTLLLVHLWDCDLMPICPDKSGPQCLNISFILWKIKRRGVLIAQGHICCIYWVIYGWLVLRNSSSLHFSSVWHGTNVCSFSLLLVKCAIWVKQTEISDHPS